MGLTCIALAVGLSGRAATVPEGVRVPIVMYHSVLKDQKRLGKYVLSPDTLAADLAYLAERGYQSVTMSELIDYVNGRGELPQKPIVLTFDDGYYNNYVYAYPLLKQYGYRAVISIIGKMSDAAQTEEHPSAYYSHLTWTQLKEMMDSGLIEVQNHSYNLHTNAGRNGAAKKRGEDISTYTHVLEEDIGRLQTLLQNNIGYTPNTFTYPFGSTSTQTDDILHSMGFEATLSCVEGPNYIDRGSSLYRLKRYNRPSGISTENFFKKMGVE
nr:polysaccharide deacetylase family protein [bacterium]